MTHCRRRGVRQWSWHRCGGPILHIGFYNPPARSRPRDSAEVNALVRGNPTRQRRGFDAAIIRHALAIAAAGLRRLNFSRCFALSVAFTLDAFTTSANDRDHRAFADFITRLSSQFQQFASAARFNLYRRLVRLKFCDDIARADSIANLLEPVDQQAIHHELDFMCHLNNLLDRANYLLGIRQRQQFDLF